jgi:hypothetical protein
MVGSRVVVAAGERWGRARLVGMELIIVLSKSFRSLQMSTGNQREKEGLSGHDKEGGKPEQSGTFLSKNEFIVRGSKETLADRATGSGERRPGTTIGKTNTTTMGPDKRRDGNNNSPTGSSYMYSKSMSWESSTSPKELCEDLMSMTRTRSLQ